VRMVIIEVKVKVKQRRRGRKGERKGTRKKESRVLVQGFFCRVVQPRLSSEPVTHYTAIRIPLVCVCPYSLQLILFRT
jgi:hypothetical protein